MSATDTLAAALVAARAGQRATDGFPGEVPTSPAAAYAVQHAAMRLRGHGIAGFKVGGVPAAFAQTFPDGWLAGPISSEQIYPVANKSTINFPVFEGGMAAYEAEYMLTLSGLDRLNGSVETLEAAKQFISKVNIGAEIASSPFRGTNNLGPGAIISDFGVQGGIALGPEISLAALENIGDVEVSITIDQDTPFTAHPRMDESGPFGALRFLLNHIQTLPDDIAIPDTLILSSGAVTGVHQSRSDTSGRFDFGRFGQFTLRLVPHANFNS